MLKQTKKMKTAKNKKKIILTKLDVLYTIVVIQLFSFALLLHAIIINLLNN